MSRAIKVLLGVLGALAALAVLAYVFRDAVATYAFNLAMDRNERIDCTETQLEVARSLDVVVIAPLECEVRGGPITRVKTSTPARVHLGGLTPERITTARATFDFRDREPPDVESDTSGDLANLVGLRDSLVLGLVDGAAAYSKDAPRIEVERMTNLRGGKPDGVMYGYASWVDGKWNRSRAERVQTGMEDLVAVRDFEMRVTPERGRVSMQIHLAGADEPDTIFRLEASGLDRREPQVDVSLIDPDDIRAATRRSSAPLARRAPDSDP